MLRLHNNSMGWQRSDLHHSLKALSLVISELR